MVVDQLITDVLKRNLLYSSVNYCFCSEIVSHSFALRSKQVVH